MTITYVKPIGRLAADRYDFLAHVEGTGFRQKADTVDLPIPLIGLGNATTVQEALDWLNTHGTGGGGGVINLSDLSATVGVLPIVRGGTGLSSVGSNGTVFISNGTVANWQNITNNNISSSANIDVGKLAPGTSGQMLVTVGGVASWSSTGSAASPNRSVQYSNSGVLGGAAHASIASDGYLQISNDKAGGSALTGDIRFPTKLNISKRNFLGTSDIGVAASLRGTAGTYDDFLVIGSDAVTGGSTGKVQTTTMDSTIVYGRKHSTIVALGDVYGGTSDFGRATVSAFGPNYISGNTSMGVAAGPNFILTGSLPIDSLITGNQPFRDGYGIMVIKDRTTATTSPPTAGFDLWSDATTHHPTIQLPNGEIHDLLAGGDGYGIGPRGENSSIGSILSASTSNLGLLVFNGAGSVTLKGLADGEDRRWLVIRNKTGQILTIEHDSASAVAANRIFCPNDGYYILANDEAVLAVYDVDSGGTPTPRWVLVGGNVSGGGMLKFSGTVTVRNPEGDIGTENEQDLGDYPDGYSKTLNKYPLIGSGTISKLEVYVNDFFGNPDATGSVRVYLNDNPIIEQTGIVNADAGTVLTMSVDPVPYSDGYVLEVGLLINAGTGGSECGISVAAIVNVGGSGAQGSSGGEATTASNVGTGQGGIFRSKTGSNLDLKTIKAGTNITVTNNADDVTISASGGGSAAGVAGDLQMRDLSTSAFAPLGNWKGVDGNGILRATYWDDADGVTIRAGIQVSAGTFNNPQVFPDFGFIRLSSLFYTTGGWSLLTIAEPSGASEYGLMGMSGGTFFVGNTDVVIPTEIIGNGVSIAGGSSGISIFGNTSISGSLTLSTPLSAANGGTGLTSPGASGNVLTSNGTSWVSSAPSGGGGSPGGVSGQIQTNNGAGGFAGPGPYAGTNWISVGVSGTPTSNGLRLASAYVLSFRNNANTSDINVLQTDSLNNLYIGGAGTGAATIQLNATSGGFSVRTNGSQRLLIQDTLTTSSVPIDFSAGATTVGTAIRLPDSNLKAIVAGTKPVIASDSTTVYVGTDNIQSTQSSRLFLFAGTNVSLGTGSTSYIEMSASGGIGGVRFALPRVGLNTMFASDGQVTIPITTSGKTLVASEYSRKIWKFTGSSGGSGNITVPDVSFEDYSVTKVVRNASTTSLVFSNSGTLTTTIHGGRAGCIHITPDGVFGFDYSTSATGSTVTGQA